MPSRPRSVSQRTARLVGLSGIAALGVLVACGRTGGDTRAHAGDGEPTARASQELVSGAEQYVGATSLAAKQLALTFDDGPGTRTAELSTYLKDQNIRAVFFVNGACIQATALPNNSCATPTANATAILAQLEADGHLVANHTTTHRDLAVTVPANQRVQELSETDALITQYGKTPYNRSLFRAPFGSWSNTVYTTLAASAMSHYVGPIYWDIGGFSNRYPNAAADWACFQGSQGLQGGGLIHSAPGDPLPDGFATTQECGDAYLAEVNAVGRGIILLHDPYGWAQGSTVDMVKYLVPLLKNAGYTFVRADEVPLIAADLPACGGTGCVTCSGPGPSQCTSCVAGRYLAASGTCAVCSSCAGGTYQAAACSANADTVCTACDPSCATCTGAGPTACATCDPGKYLSGGSCKTCTTCAPGSYATSACTVTADTTCTACAACGPATYESTACTPTTNRACAACHPSCKACTGPAAADCAACPSGTYAKAESCEPCTSCAAGSYAASACSATSDTVCSPCAAGTFASEAGATTCTSCGACDDGDACTADACDAARGCTHTPIAGCTGGADAGKDDDAGAQAQAFSVGAGCGVATGSASGVWPFALAAAVLGLGRRRRRAA